MRSCSGSQTWPINPTVLPSVETSRGGGSPLKVNALTDMPAKLNVKAKLSAVDLASALDDAGLSISST